MDVLIQSLVQANFAPERIIPRASMAQYTTFRVGGVADVLVNIASADEIPVALSAAKKADVPVTIIGCGSNLLVRDGGIRGLVLRISSAMSAIRRVGDDLIAEAGAPLGAIAAFARDEGLCGMAELAGIPGTIGGGVVMNAGAYGTELAQVVSSVDCVSLHNGKPIHYSADKLDFSYRHSALMDANVVAAQVTLSLKAGDPQAIRARPLRSAKRSRWIPPSRWASIPAAVRCSTRKPSSTPSTRAATVTTSPSSFWRRTQKRSLTAIRKLGGIIR